MKGELHMKILGIIDGRPKRVTDFYCQTALKAAEEAGCEVELVNLRQLDIKPCNGCCLCHRGGRPDGKLGCVYDDDMVWLDEKIMECDGLIVAAPCFECSPPSEMKKFCDRLGPSHDVMLRRDMDEHRKAQGLSVNDPRWYKDRPCAFISHGGSEWTTLGLPVLSIIAVPLGMTIVDLVNISFMGTILKEGTLDRVKALGRAVAANCGKTAEEMVYYGDPAVCPCCHNNAFVLTPGTNEVVCASCGLEGTISVENGQVRTHHTPEQLKGSHVTISGKTIHMMDMTGRGKEIMRFQREHQKEIDELIKQGTAYYSTSKPQKN